MPLQKPFPYAAGFRPHIFIALILGALLSFILIVLEPVGVGDMNGFFGNAQKLGYGIAVALGYLVSHFLANLYFRKIEQWTWGDEIVFQLFSGLLGITLAYLYHDFVINAQAYSIRMYLGFLLYLGLPIFPLLLAPVVLLRYLVVKSMNLGDGAEVKKGVLENQIEYLKLQGDNQNDELILPKDKILYIKSVENYVQLFYMDEDVVAQKMFRSTLANMNMQADFLMQAHRSYLINPFQPFNLKGNSQKSELLHKTLKESIPVSRSYYPKIKKVLTIHPKKIVHSSQK